MSSRVGDGGGDGAREAGAPSATPAPSATGGDALRHPEAIQEALQSIASTVGQMQETMLTMIRKMERTDEAVRGVERRLTQQGVEVQRIGDRMADLDRTLHQSPSDAPTQSRPHACSPSRSASPFSKFLDATRSCPSPVCRSLSTHNRSQEPSPTRTSSTLRRPFDPHQAPRKESLFTRRKLPIEPSPTSIHQSDSESSTSSSYSTDQSSTYSSSERVSTNILRSASSEKSFRRGRRTPTPPRKRQLVGSPARAFRERSPIPTTSLTCSADSRKDATPSPPVQSATARNASAFSDCSRAVPSNTSPFATAHSNITPQSTPSFALPRSFSSHLAQNSRAPSVSPTRSPVSKSLSCTTSVPSSGPRAPHAGARVPWGQSRTVPSTPTRCTSPPQTLHPRPRQALATARVHSPCTPSSSFRPGAFLRLRTPNHTPTSCPLSSTTFSVELTQSSSSASQGPPAHASASYSDATDDTACCPEENVNRRAVLGRRLLAAAHEGKVDRVRYLLDAGADVNCNNSLRWTPLHKAAAKAHAGVLSLLLQRGADATAATSYGFTALHMAAYNDRSGRCVARLIEAGAALDGGNRSGRTPLHAAVECGNVSGMLALLAAGANKHVKDEEGREPFDMAKSVSVRRLLRVCGHRPRPITTKPLQADSLKRKNCSKKTITRNKTQKICNKTLPGFNNDKGELLLLNILKREREKKLKTIYMERR